MQYKQGREHQEHDAHLVAFAAEMLARQSVAKLVNDFGDRQRDAQIDPVLGFEELMERGKLVVERVELHQHQRQGREGQNRADDPGRHAVKPANLGIEPVENAIRVDALEAESQNIGEPRQKFFPFLFATALGQLLALARDVRNHQAVGVQHPDELPQLFHRDFLGRKELLEFNLDFVEARIAVEHLQDRVFFFLKAEVVQADRFLDHPIDLAQIALLLGRQIGPHPHREHPCGAGNHTIGQCHHGIDSESLLPRRRFAIVGG